MNACLVVSQRDTCADYARRNTCRDKKRFLPRRQTENLSVAPFSRFLGNPGPDALTNYNSIVILWMRSA